jgi:uncharacterized Fe-S cluster-containing MiaB family protein
MGEIEMKVVKKHNFRVEVFPDTFLVDKEDYKRMISNCNSIIDDIKRHVDDVDRMEIEYDVEVLCSHCKSEWEEESTGKPVCCEAAVLECIEEKKEAS